MLKRVHRCSVESLELYKQQKKHCQDCMTWFPILHKGSYGSQDLYRLLCISLSLCFFMKWENIYYLKTKITVYEDIYCLLDIKLFFCLLEIESQNPNQSFDVEV